MSTRYLKKKRTDWVRDIIFVSLMVIFASNKAIASVSEYFAGTTNVPNATVRINETVGKTNSDGSFGFHAARADQYAISVSKPGYALVSIIEKWPNKNLVFTLKKAELISISIADHSKGITIKDSRNTNIQLPANAFGKVNEPINAYVYTYDNSNESMPGNMSAINSDGKDVYLLSAGVFWAEFVGASSGKKYNLAPNKNATISVPTPANKENEVPTLWSFDETTGKWIEEGFASINRNGRLEGKVSHFSAWNFDWKRGEPACVKIELTKSLFDTYNIGTSPQTVEIKVVVTSPSGIVNTRTNTENNATIPPWLIAIYNIPPNSTVEVFVKDPSSGTFVSRGTVNAGAPWGGTGIPPNPYDVCNGKITLNPPPLSVSLDTFTANAADGKVTINWTTGSETNNAGFTLWRATPKDGQCSLNPSNYKDVKQVQPLVYSKSQDGVLGADYSEEDQDVEAGVTYCYGLEDVDYDGIRKIHVDKIISATLN
jgi:hypothetical protein